MPDNITTANPAPIIEVLDVEKSFKKGDRQELLVLKDVNFRMNEGEVVAILGKSGSGKSTLLRIIAGLVAPTAGHVTYRGQSVYGPVRGTAMVFQNFALLPWLTVLQNVELGLEALGVGRDERRERALKAIDTIGLDGFESAFPKELSGGMRQRVGFARALVVNPDLLLMDEPFSALDVLTADNLKSDLMDLWRYSWHFICDA
jgi:NitT/TauT family transport system ATP-binding protein